MTSAPLAILGCGLISGVGLTAAESCAAVRAGLNNFQETRFLHKGQWLVGSVVALEAPWRSLDKLAKMAARAVAECFAASGDEAPEHIPVLVCVSEIERPGRLEGLAPGFLKSIGAELAIRLHPLSRVLAVGRVGGLEAFVHARRMLSEGQCTRIIVVGVDSYFTSDTLAAYADEQRLLSDDNSDGFIPGEAAAAVLLGSVAYAARAPCLVRGVGFGSESAFLGSGMPLRAQGLCDAIRAALEDAGLALKDCDCRIADINGEHYRFKEAALAITRLLRDRKKFFSLWHPADCLGEIGAAALPAMLAVLFHGALKHYLPGPTFIGHLGNDDGRRAAFVAQATSS